MAISRVEIIDYEKYKNDKGNFPFLYTPFTGDFAVDFCPGINVVIGDNGLGKTTLLKGMYRCVSAIIRGRSEDGILIINDGNIRFQYDNVITFLAVDDSIQTVFIPEKDMLSHSKGFLALCKDVKMPFDYTLVDILAKAQRPETNDIKPNAAKLLERIKRVIGGEVIYDNDEFFVRKSNGSFVPFSFEASGYRKFGILWRLLRNGLLETGSILFWDEPENSLNPKLVPELVEILLGLAKSGVQIFLATHDYNLARYFDVRKDRNIPVIFHNLSKIGDRPILCNSSAEYIKLPNNLLEKASADLFDAVVDAAMEVTDNE